MLMRKYAMLTSKAMLLLSLSACHASSAIGATTEPPKTQRDSEEIMTRTSESTTLEATRTLANKQNLIGSHGANFSYLDEDGKGNFLIIHETFSSRTQYKTLTPIISTESGNLIIDCTLIRALEDSKAIAVGNYCRGKSIASIEAIDDAVSDEWTHVYSSSLPWLQDAAAKVNCMQPRGLDFMELRVLRCQDGEDDETTSNVATYVLSPSLAIKLSMREFEFAGSIGNKNSLIFWRLNESSHHEIIAKNVH